VILARAGCGLPTLALALGLAVVCSGRVTAAPRVDAPRDLCGAAILAAEREAALPPGLLAAIGRVESARPDPVTGRVLSWPWTINAEGEGRFFASQAEAVAAVQELAVRGVRVVDVGCMQVNLFHHAEAFASLEQAFDPVANARYAARFLKRLHAAAGDWVTAAGHYHSTTAERAEGYRTRVLAAWPQGQAMAAAAAAPVVDPALRRQDQIAEAWATSQGLPAAKPVPLPVAGRRDAGGSADRMAQAWTTQRGAPGSAAVVPVLRSAAVAGTGPRCDTAGRSTTCNWVANAGTALAVR
jgi:hypothetical protein